MVGTLSPTHSTRESTKTKQFKSLSFLYSMWYGTIPVDEVFFPGHSFRLSACWCETPRYLLFSSRLQHYTSLSTNYLLVCSCLPATVTHPFTVCPINNPHQSFRESSRSIIPYIHPTIDLIPLPLEEE